MDAVDDYCASPDELMSSTNRTRFNRNSKINSFRSIIGVGGRRTGWTGPRCLKRDSSGLVDVHEFFSKDFSPISGSGHRRSNANTEDISVKNDGGFVFNKISPDNEINSRSNSGESCVTIPVSPPLHLEARKESVEVPVKREKVEEQKVAQGPSRDNSPIPAINGKDLMLSKSISFYEKLENSFLASKCPDNVDGVACTRSSRRHTDNAGVETPKSPSASGTDFSLDSLIDEVRAPLKIKGKRKNNNKQKKKSSSSASSEVSLYSNLEFIKILTPKTPLEKFSTNFSHDLSSDNLDDYSIKLSSISTPFYPSSGSVSISSNNNAGLSESLGSLSNDEAMTPSKTNFINSSKVISAAGENSTHLTSKFNNKTHTIQAFDMTLDISEADKQKMIIKPSPCNDEINPPQPDKSATANVYTDRSHSITQSRPMLNNQKETNISSKPHHSTQKDMSPPPPQNVPSINLQELPKNLSMSPVNVMQYGENQILENEVQHKISATESRVLQSPAHPLTSGCHQLPTFEREPSPFFAGNDIDIVPSPRADTLPNGHEDSQSLLAKLPSPAPNFDQYAADSHEDQMPARPNVYKSPHKSSSLKKSPVLPALSSYTNLTVTDSSASEKPKRKRGRVSLTN